MPHPLQNNHKKTAFTAKYIRAITYIYLAYAARNIPAFGSGSKSRDCEKISPCKITASVLSPVTANYVRWLEEHY